MPQDKLNQTSRLRVDIPELEPWNGLDQSGNPVLSRNRYIPNPEVDSSKNMLIELTCNQELIFGNNYGHLLGTSAGSKALRHLASLFKDLVACRGEEPENDPLIFLTRYGVWAPLFWLYLGDEGAEGFPLPSETDWLRELFLKDGRSFSIENLPKSCDFEHFVTQGVCRFEFTGLNPLFSLDLTLRFEAKLCNSEGDALIPSYSAECVGSDCRFLKGLVPCDSNSDCGNLQCKNFFDYMVEIGDLIQEHLSWPNSFVSHISNRTFLEVAIEKNDPAYIFLSKERNPGDFCTRPTYLTQDTSWIQFSPNERDFSFGLGPDLKCYGGSRWGNELHQMALKILGSEEAPTVSSKLQLCAPAVGTFDPENLENWAKALVDTDELKISLNEEYFHFVEEAEPTQGTPRPTPTGGSIPGFPGCRCSENCRSLGAACTKCFNMGGMILEGFPDQCFCPSTFNFFPRDQVINWSPGMPGCPNPLSYCPDCNRCHPTCDRCFGNSPNNPFRCLGCSDPSHVLVTRFDQTTGDLLSGACFGKCPEGQHRNENGICVQPSCSELNDCSGNGECLYSRISDRNYCKCKPGFSGSDCSETPDCSQYNDCSGNGNCVFGRYFQAGRCECYPGYGSANCSQIVTTANPASDSELGGTEIRVNSGPFFELNDTVKCRFGDQEVEGVVHEQGYVSCIAPPSPSSRTTVPLAVQRNGGEWKFAETPFVYVYSSRLLPRTEEEVMQLLWPTSELRTVSWNSEHECMSGASNVSIKLYTWNWNPFSGVGASQEMEVVEAILEENIANSGKFNLSLDLGQDFSFGWEQDLLHILSVESERCADRRYVIPVDSNPNYEQMCQRWSEAEGDLSRAFINEIPSCPPSLWVPDPSYERHPDCNQPNGRNNPEENCYVNNGALGCRISTGNSFPQELGGQLCCYGSSGRLLVAGDEGAGFPLRYGAGANNEIRLVKSLLGDVLPRILCCHLSQNCELFTSQRPANDGELWINPQLTGVNGDPHFVTLDGLFYTFNGLGEYILLESVENNFEIQGRLSLAPSSGSNPANATILTAIAVKDGGESFSAYLDELEGISFVVDNDFVESIPEGSTYQSVNNTIFITAEPEPDHYVALLPSGVIIELSADEAVLTAFSVLPQFFRNKTRGLLGTWNGNRDDDFTLPDGSDISSTSTQEEIFNGFGALYALTAERSLFIYPDGQSFDDYNNPLFVPDFTSTSFPSASSQEIAREACSQAPNFDACMYDVAQTGNFRLANVALQAGAVFQTFEAAINQPPVLVANLPSLLQVRLDQSVVVSFTISDPNDESVSLTAISMPPGTSIEGNMANFVVSESMFLDENIIPLIVVARDAGNSVSEQVTTTFELIYSNCSKGGASATQREATLLLASKCVAGECAAECSKEVQRILSLGDSCRDEVISALGDSFLGPQETCCLVDENVECPRDGQKGLGTGAIAGIAVGAGVVVLILAGAASYFFILKSKKTQEHGKEMVEM